jgi:hypothetical protein
MIWEMVKDKLPISDHRTSRKPELTFQPTKNVRETTVMMKSVGGYLNQSGSCLSGFSLAFVM